MFVTMVVNVEKYQLDGCMYNLFYFDMGLVESTYNYPLYSVSSHILSTLERDEKLSDSKCKIPAKLLSWFGPHARYRINDCMPRDRDCDSRQVDRLRIRGAPRSSSPTRFWGCMRTCA